MSQETADQLSASIRAPAFSTARLNVAVNPEEQTNQSDQLERPPHSRGFTSPGRNLNFSTALNLNEGHRRSSEHPPEGGGVGSGLS